MLTPTNARSEPTRESDDLQATAYTAMRPSLPDPEYSLHTAALWLMEYLESSKTPCLVREVQLASKRIDMAPALLHRAAAEVPLLRRPREMRGPWVWALPDPEELVRVRYRCPIVDCGKTCEGWMQFRLSRILFPSGLIRYLTRGTSRRTQPPDGSSTFLRLETKR